MKTMRRLLAAGMLLLCVLQAAGAQAQQAEGDSEWITFLLICNEGMLNDGGNVGNTIMVLSLNPSRGIIKELTFLWDTFIEYPGFETLQLLDQPFRVKGPDETLRLFNMNFGQDIEAYLSLNFLNLADVIDSFGGVNVAVTRAERNALNGMVTSKAEIVLGALTSAELDESQYEKLLGEYYLMEYGPNVHLSGLQAVGFGWLQYDSVVNCCTRELSVIAQLIFQMRKTVEERVWFYREGETSADNVTGKRPINLDDMSESDRQFLLSLVSPLFDRAAHNLSEEQIYGIVEAILRSTVDERGEVSAFSDVQMCILPLEYNQPRERIGSSVGTVINFEANKMALEAFLYDPDYAPMTASSAVEENPWGGQP